MNETDPRLLLAAQCGEERAFLDLYSRYRTPLFHFAFRLTNSQPASEDIVQDCFLALMAGTSYNTSQGSLRAYLFGITRNLAFQRMRVAERECDEADGETAADSLDNLLAAERSEMVAHAISALPPHQREALVLFEYHEMSIEEIAQIAGIETGAVKARLHRARETLRRRLSPLLASHS